MHTFIAHARADEFFVRQIAAVLERFGFSTWWDTAYESAEPIQRNVHDAIGFAHAFIFVVSPQAVESRQVQAEIELARELAIPIIPILRTRRRDLVPQQWQGLLEQSLALDACDPEALDEVFDLLLSRLEAIVDRSPPRYVSAHHILREMKADEHFGLPTGGTSIRPQIEEVVSEFGALAGSLELFDRIEESLTQQRGTPGYCEAGRSLDAASADDTTTDVHASWAALTRNFDVRRGEIAALCHRLRSLTAAYDVEERVEGAADKDVWGWVHPSAGAYFRASGVSSSFWPEPSTRFMRSGDSAEKSQNHREITDALSRVAAGGRDRRDKSERLLSELGLQSLSTLLTQVVACAIKARPADNVADVISEAVQGALLRAEVTDAGATGLPNGMIVGLVDILDSNTNLARSGLRPVAVRPLWSDLERSSGQDPSGAAIFAGTDYPKGKLVVVGGGTPYLAPDLDPGDALVGLAHCMSLRNPNTRPQ